MTKNKKIGEMPAGTAKARLRKKLIFHLLESLNKNVCNRCDQKISSEVELSIEHLNSDDIDSYWNLNNIAFSHPACSSGAAKQRGQNMLVNIELEDKNGNKLSTYTHEGSIYIAGQKNKEYNIRVTNKSSYKLEAVITVDGRDVITGEPGDVNSRGYLISPFGDTLIKGFRKDFENVAAFKFSGVEKSYSAKLGTGYNVGVIGVAIFRQKEVFNWITKPIDIFTCDSYGTPAVTYGATNMTYTADTWTSPLIGTVSTSSINTGANYSANLSLNTANVRRGRGKTTKNTENLSDDLNFDRERKVDTLENQIGTEYGATLKSKTREESFIRNNTLPDEICQMFYDTKEGLKARGININPPKQKQAFPMNPEIIITRKFAQPPK